MTAVKTKFDGHQIIVPQELRSSSPRELVIVFDETQLPPAPAASIWEAFGKAPQRLDAATLEARLRVERDSWGDR